MNVIIRERSNSCCDTIPADDLKIGQMAVMAAKNKYKGDVVLRTYIGLVSLTHPDRCWSGDYNQKNTYDQVENLPSFMVRVISSNQEVVLQPDECC